MYLSDEIKNSGYLQLVSILSISIKPVLNYINRNNNPRRWIDFLNPFQLVEKNS